MATNLAIDPELLNRALEVGGEKTKKATVTRALQEFIARREQERLLDLLCPGATTTLTQPNCTVSAAATAFRLEPPTPYSPSSAFATNWLCWRLTPISVA